MARTLEEIDQALTALDAEVAVNRRDEVKGMHPLRQMAGYFTGDAEWKEIFEEIQRQRDEEFKKTQESDARVAP
jgi:hypothetical protein